MVASLILPLQSYGQDVLKQYQSQYRKGLAAVDLTFREKRLAMPGMQVQALRQLEAAFQRSGDLRSMLAVQKERERFVLDPRGSSIPSLQTPQELVRVLENYKTRFAEIAREREVSSRNLNVQYQAALKKLQISLTQQGNIDDAKEVMQVLASLAPVLSVPDAPTPGMSSPPDNANSPAVAPAGTGKTGVGEDEFFKDWFQ